MTPVPQVTLVLADRPACRPALVALAGAVEASALGERVGLALVRGAAAVGAAAAAAGAGGRPVAVLWSFLSGELEEVAAELARVREAAPEALQVAGGVHASAEPEATRALGFDLVVRGEGEAAAVRLAAALLAGQRPGGVWARGPGQPLDAHPGCSRRLGKALALEITRGCVWACRFCQTPFLHRAAFRHRSIAGARAFARFARALGHRDLRFLTPSALSFGAEGGEAALEAVEALLAAVREELGPGRRLFFGTFPSELRPEHVTPAALALVARYADNREVLLGAQSGSDRLLAALGRGHGTAEVERAVAYVREAGLTASVDFVVGLPGETPEDLLATHRLMARVAEAGARVHGHVFLPLPGTPWRGEPPGALAPATRALLDRLASQGRAYGQWRRQAHLAARLGGRVR